MNELDNLFRIKQLQEHACFLTKSLKSLCAQSDCPSRATTTPWEGKLLAVRRLECGTGFGQAACLPLPVNVLF